MLRSAAKNHAAVAVLSSPSQYGELLGELDAHAGCTSRALRRRLAAAVYATTAAYDSAISRWFSGQLGGEAAVFTRTYEKKLALKYGCNPHQNPAFVGRLADTPAMPFEVLNGTPGAYVGGWVGTAAGAAGGARGARAHSHPRTQALSALPSPVLLPPRPRAQATSIS